MLILSSGVGLRSALGKTIISDRHQIRVRVRVSSGIRVAVRFGSLSACCVCSHFVRSYRLCDCVQSAFSETQTHTQRTSLWRQKIHQSNKLMFEKLYSKRHQSLVLIRQTIWKEQTRLRRSHCCFLLKVYDSIVMYYIFFGDTGSRDVTSG